MSVRRRAIKARMERDALLKKGSDEMTRSLNNVLDLCDRKTAAGDKTITPEELGEAMREGWGGMIHVHDWLDDPANKDHLAREFLEHARRPAMQKDNAWLRANRPSAMYEGKRYAVVGASRLGDVWLKDDGDGQPNAFYSLRVDIGKLSEWRSHLGGG